MCEICSCDGPPTFERTQVQVARKLYQCVECDGPIPIDRQYRYLAGLWEDSTPNKVQVFRTCLACSEDWETLIKIVSKHEGEPACECVGGLRNAVHEALDCGCLEPNDPLAEKWAPDVAAEMKQQAAEEFLGIVYDPDQLCFAFVGAL